ncbi:MAG: hypothetical protein FWD24_02505 [Treponema sp.]|nr:hypothetical protein [Treponema sp.]
MKKKILLFILLIFIFQYSYSNNNLFDGSLRILIPESSESSVSFYFNIGYGKYFPVITNNIYLGIYIDAGIGWDWMYLISLFSAERQHHNSGIYYYFGFNLGYNFGIRFFSLFDISLFDLMIFAGYNLSSLMVDVKNWEYGIVHNPNVGISTIIELRSSPDQSMGLGLEYAYYIPVFSERISLHHFSIMFRFDDRYWF